MIEITQSMFSEYNEMKFEVNQWMSLNNWLNMEIKWYILINK